MSSANGAPPQHGRAAITQELATLLPQALQLVLHWIQKGREPDCPVAPWPTSEELRANISLQLPDEAVTEQQLLSAMQTVLDNSVNPWTGRFLDKLYAAPTPVGLAAEMILSALNANAHVFSASPMLSLAEERTVAGLADAFGFDPDEADGLTMPGGSAANTLAVQTALANHFPAFREQGVLGVAQELATRGAAGVGPVLFTSEQSHYSLDKAAIASGLGLRAVRKVACDKQGRMDVEALERAIVAAREGTGKGAGAPFFVNATSGSTVMGSFDTLQEIAAVTRKHNCWLHIDASWGGPVIFSEKWQYLMKGSELADSITINPHKLLNVPHQCSYLIIRRGTALNANALSAAYLFHGASLRDNAGLKTMGCGRRGDALKFYLAWQRYGRTGFGAHVDAGFTLARRVVDYVRKQADVELGPMPEDLFLQVCFRPALPAQEQERMDRTAQNERASTATRYVHATLRERKRFAVDFAPLPDDAGDFIRLVVHPRTDWQDLSDLVDEVAAIGRDYWVSQPAALAGKA